MKNLSSTFACLIALITISQLFQGCGTIAQRRQGGLFMPDDVNEGPMVYGGIKYDASVLSVAGEKESLRGVFGCLFSPIAIIDLPFSFLADTIMLPITIPEVHRMKHHSNVETNKTETIPNKFQEDTDASAPDPQK